MNPADKLAQQMRLPGPNLRRPLTGEERVTHENSTPEERAEKAVQRQAKAEAEVAAQKALEIDSAFASRVYIESQSLTDAVAACNKAVTIENMTIRAAPRAAYERGFRAGWQSRHNRPTL